MNIDFASFQRTLAKKKVYDTWQFVESLLEHISYMEASFDLANSVYKRRQSKLEELGQRYLDTVSTKGKATATSEDSNCTHVEVAGLDFNDGVILRKSVLEVFIILG